VTFLPPVADSTGVDDSSDSYDGSRSDDVTSFSSNPYGTIGLPILKVNCVIGQPPFLTTDQQRRLIQMLNRHQEAFSTNETPIGQCENSILHINLTDDKPVSCMPYRLTEPDRQFALETVNEWIRQGICRYSESPYAAPAFIVEQIIDDGSKKKRLVVDYVLPHY
jgi:hypothetical protein